MTQVLILNPPRHADGSATLFNNATISLASYLWKHGVSARTEPLMGAYWIDTLDQLLAEHQPEVIAISCKWWDTLYGAVELARLIRQRAPHVKLVTGGQTATYFAQDIVKKTEFDAVIRGDGEQPLLEFALGKPSCNITLKDGTELPQTYVQTSQDDLRLHEDLTDIALPDMLLAIGYDVPFIWTGKGCRLTCMYCAGSALGHKQLFGRKGYLYRPVEHILHDLEVWAPWTRNNFMLDFDPIADPQKRDYYMDFFRQIPKDQYHISFYCWTLPDEEFVDLIGERFKSAFISLDAQAYSEEHRERLWNKRMIKPFRSNTEFEQIMMRITSYPHMDTGIYGILGLPGETETDVTATETWIGELFGRFGNGLGELAITPLATEPGSLVHRNAGKYKMKLLRETFEDYLEFTGLKFHGSKGIHGQEYDVNLPHPYGVIDENEHPSRVYQDYHRINERIKATFDQRNTLETQDILHTQGNSLILTLRNRGQHRHVWHHVIWAIGVARSQGLKQLIVDARTAFIHMPEKAVMELSRVHEYSRIRLSSIEAAIKSGELEVIIYGEDRQHWGALAEIGVTFRKENELAA